MLASRAVGASRAPNVRAETGAAVGRQAREEHDSHWRIAGLVHRRLRLGSSEGLGLARARLPLRVLHRALRD